MRIKVNGMFFIVLVASLGCFGASDYQTMQQENCPDGFLSYPGDKCLHVSTKYVTGQTTSAYQWEEARQECLNMNSGGCLVDLVYSLNEEIMQAFTKYIINEQSNMTGYVFHVGAEKDTPSGQWEWVDGQRVDPYSYIWNINMPTDNYVKTKLVPSGAFNRFYMLGISAKDYAPSFVCQASPQCST